MNWEKKHKLQQSSSNDPRTNNSKIYVRAGEGENEREKEYTLTLDKQGTELIQGIFSLTVNGQEIEPIGNIYNAYISENAETVAVTAITINDNDLVKLGKQKLKFIYQQKN